MRIISEQNYRNIKITTLKHLTTVSIKFERDSIEFTLKFRDDININEESGAKKFLDAKILNEIDKQMEQISISRTDAFHRNFKIEDEEELPTII